MTAVHCVVALLELLLFASVVSGEISQTSSIGEVATMDFNTSVMGGEVECGPLSATGPATGIEPCSHA